MNVVLWMEGLKLRRAPINGMAGLAVVCGIPMAVTILNYAMHQNNPLVLAKLGKISTPWGMAVAMLVGAGLLVNGIFLSWLFAREFTDGTISGLFNIPQGRSAVAFAKLAVYFAWSMVILLLLMCVLSLGFGFSWTNALRLLSVGLSNVILALPAAVVATKWRSLLAGVGASVTLVIIGQLGALMPGAQWIPWSAPALWSVGADAGIHGRHLVWALIVCGVWVPVLARQWQSLKLS